jgi:DNA-directed RNA polymerase specialized sigma24 family protein
VEKLIDKLSKKHKDWVHMAMSFGMNRESANEIVQEMYIRVTKYVDDPERIMYNEKELNNYYIYVTLRNLFLSRFHSGKKSNHLSLDEVNEELIHTKEYNKEYEDSFDLLISKIEETVDSWYWYDKKLWNIHFKNEMSMRRISRETRISLSSIFNTLTNGKKNVRENSQKEYKRYKNSKN